MRKVLTIVFVLSAAACATPARWEKPGTDEKTTASDVSACRRAAQDETMRDYPYYPWWYPLGRSFYWYQRVDLDRFYMEDRLTAFCMRNKGYVLVQIEPQTAPPSQPASPEK